MTEIILPTQGRLKIPGVTPPPRDKETIQKLEAKLQHNQGSFLIQFPNLEPEFCPLNLEHFVPTYEFEDCVFGEYLGSILKIFKKGSVSLELEGLGKGTWL